MYGTTEGVCVVTDMLPPALLLVEVILADGPAPIAPNSLLLSAGSVNEEYAGGGMYE